jgi:tRNA(Arg) A34 adenosine deaminase TadA
VSDPDEQFLRQAIDVARAAREAGNHPFGAVLVVDGAAILTAANTVVTGRDPTAHAEANLISDAIHRLTPGQIARGTLYASCEPCAMCAGAMFWAGVRRVVYGLSAIELASLAGGRFVMPCRELWARASDPVTVTGPLLVDEARRVHLGYWSAPGRPHA